MNVPLRLSATGLLTHFWPFKLSPLPLSFGDTSMIIQILIQKKKEKRKPRGPFLRCLTCIPEFLVPVHGQDDEDVAQDVYHDGEDQHAGQRSGHSGGRGAQPAAALVAGQTVRPVPMLQLEIHVPSGRGGHGGGPLRRSGEK